MRLIYFVGKKVDHSWGAEKDKRYAVVKSIKLGTEIKTYRLMASAISTSFCARLESLAHWSTLGLWHWLPWWSFLPQLKQVIPVRPKNHFISEHMKWPTFPHSMHVASCEGTFHGRSVQLNRWWSRALQIVHIMRLWFVLLWGHSRLTCPGTPQLKQTLFRGQLHKSWPIAAHMGQGLNLSSSFGQFVMRCPTMPQWLHFLEISRSQYLLSLLTPLPLEASFFLFDDEGADSEARITRPSSDWSFILSTNFCAVLWSSNTTYALPVDRRYSSRMMLTLMTGPIISQARVRLSAEVA